MPTEIVITIKTEDKVYKQKFLEYPEDKGAIELSHNNLALISLVQQAMDSFGISNPSECDIIVKATLIW